VTELVGLPHHSPSKTGRIRLTLARAMTFKPVSEGALAVEENFAVHLQGGEYDELHVIERGRVAIGERAAFPSVLWPAAEELCRQLGGLELRSGGGKELLADVAMKASRTLRQRGQEHLAEMLQTVSKHRPPGAIIRYLRWLFSTPNNRQNIALEQTLRSMLAVFEPALRKIVHAARGEALPSQTNVEAEHYYRERIDQVDQRCCFPEPPLPSFKDKPANIYSDAAFLKNYPKDATKGHLLEREALACGLSILRFPNGNFIASDRTGKRLNFKWSRSPISSGLSLSLCNHKEATRARLRRCGLPVARGRVFARQDRDKMANYAARIGYPIVCKPAAGVRGIGVVANIENQQQLDIALELYAKSALGLDDLIIEEHVNGTDYRIVVVGQQVVSVVCRSVASVIGTGVHTVADLLLHKNGIRLRNPHLRRRLIRFDDAAKYQLERAQLRLTSIPTSGQWVQLANSNNISRGGDSIEVLDELHPSIAEAALAAVKAIPGLGFCGIDMILEDHCKPLGEQKAAIIELNAHGAIGTGQYPMWGTPRNVAYQFLLYCAKREGLALSEVPAERLSVKLQIRGRVTGVGYRRWFRRKAIEYGLTGWIANSNRTTAEAILEGEVAPVAALVNAAVRGPTGAVPYWVVAEHAPFHTANPRGVDRTFGVSRPAS
jgi:D-alanine-D-alanine ligase-like ATP-grasp enzyme/acylphosphatase